MSIELVDLSGSTIDRKTLHEPLSLAALIENLRNNPSVNPRELIELRSSVKKFCAVIGRNSETWMIGQLSDVVEPMHAVNPLQCGIRDSYWRCVKSSVMRVFKLNGFEFLTGLCKIELTPSWAALVHAAEVKKRHRLLPLRPFIRRAVALGIEPSDVTQGTFEDYLVAVDQCSSRKNKVGTGPQLRTAWNECVNTIEGWPQVLFELRDGRKIYLMPDSTFPKILEEFESRVTKPMAPRGNRRGRRRLRAVTIKSRRYHFRRMLSAAVQAGINPEKLKSLRDFCDPEVLEAAFNFILDRRGAEATCDVSRLASLTIGIAEQWVEVPKEQLGELKKLYEDFACIQEGMTEKNRRMLLKFANDTIISKFLQTPKRIMDLYADVEVLSVHDAHRIQLAAAMALLIRVLVRVHNLKQIRIGHHLVEVGFGVDRKYILCFSEDEVKNVEYLETVLSPRVSSILNEYIAKARPILLREPSDYLFPGRGVGHKSGSMFSQQLANFTAKETGIRVTAHQFRHLGGFLHLLKHPGDYETVRKMLGHRKIETTVRFYAGMEKKAAFEKYDAHIEARLDAAELLGGTPENVRLKRLA